MPSSTRDRILDAAHDLVLQRGYSATTVDDVLAESGASKGGFFHHFPSKAALGEALVARYAEGDRALLERHMAAAEEGSNDPAEQLVSFLRSLEAEAIGPELAQPGCLFVSFVYERIPDTEGVRPIITDAIDAWRRRIADKLAAARADGRLPDDTDVEAVADHVFTTFEGAFVLARATGDPTHVARQLGQLRTYLELLVGDRARPSGRAAGAASAGT